MTADAASDDATVLAALPDDVRDRLVRMAAELVGALPVEQVPPALRPVARFTPVKRVRLGAAALLTQLESDDDFRERVADAVRQGFPQLAAALDGDHVLLGTDAADVLAAVVVLRPDGWQALCEQLLARREEQLAAAHAAAERSRRAEAELEAVREQLRQARELLRGEREQAEALAEQRAVAASLEATAEATRLRNLLRERTVALREAQARLDGAGAAELAGLRERADAAETRTRELRARVGELERALEAARSTRREARWERDVDQARLRLLLDTVIDAAAGVRRELALPAGPVRPGDLVARRAEGERTATGDDGGELGDVTALDRVLGLPHAHLVVDGYNVTKTGYGELPLVDQRARLLTALAGLHSRTGSEVTVAFDGAARPPVQPRAPRGVRVLFSAVGEIADDLIRRLVAAEPAGRVLVVATADREIVADVRRAGAWTVPSAVLLDLLG